MSRKNKLRRAEGPAANDLLALVREAGPTGITAQQLMLKLGLDKRERDLLQEVLGGLMAKGKVETAKRGRYVAGGSRPPEGKGGGMEALLDII
ncbi:MAG TPA: hypothetical protein PLL18_04570, partial [Flavobacteriales bacterium]|nr:hypothetical protein [Flavobacteriales bacterium]